MDEEMSGELKPKKLGKSKRRDKAPAGEGSSGDTESKAAKRARKEAKQKTLAMDLTREPIDAPNIGKRLVSSKSELEVAQMLDPGSEDERSVTDGQGVSKEEGKRVEEKQKGEKKERKKKLETREEEVTKESKSGKKEKRRMDEEEMTKEAEEKKQGKDKKDKKETKEKNEKNEKKEKKEKNEKKEKTKENTKETKEEPKEQKEKKKRKRVNDEQSSELEERPSKKESSKSHSRSVIEGINENEDLTDHAKQALIYVSQHSTAHLKSTSLSTGTTVNSGKAWKFNKAKQNWLVKHVWDQDQVPDEHLEAVIAYLKTIQGLGRSHLIEIAKKNSKPQPMDDSTTVAEGAAPNTSATTKPTGDGEGDVIRLLGPEPQGDDQDQLDKSDLERRDARMGRAKMVLKALGAR